MKCCADFKFISDDTIDVFYLQAPIFEGAYGNKLGQLGAFHTGLGFYDRQESALTFHHNT